jgi:hypothetical protein
VSSRSRALKRERVEVRASRLGRAALGTDIGARYR